MSASDTITPAERPLRADARRNRQRILDAAKAAFTVSGADAQMDDIAAAAGVGVGTVYRHFPTKDVLVRHLITQLFETFTERAEAQLADPAIAPGETLFAFLWANAEACAGDVGMQHVFRDVADPAAGSELARLSGLYDVSDRIIAEARAAGTVRPGFCSDDVGMVMCGLGSVIGSPDPAWDWRRYFTFVLDGIRARPV